MGQWAYGPLPCPNQGSEINKGLLTVLYKWDTRGALAQIDALNISLALFQFMRTIEKDRDLLNRLSVLER